MDEQLYLMAVGLSLDEKIEKAVTNLRHYEAEALKHDPVNGYYLCDSYGKDSCVILDLAKRSGVKFQAHYNLTTLDPPELVRFGRKHHPETVEHKPRVPMLVRMVESGRPPTRLVRWCCAEYKEGSGKGALVFGVRAAESVSRKANWKIWQRHRGRNNGSYILNPILYWTDKDVWMYIERFRLPYCELYDEGWDRLGCIGCPMGRKQRVRQFARWPKYELAWKRAFQKLWDTYRGIPTKRGKVRAIDRHGWETVDDYWRWWMSGESGGDDDCQMGLW